jgi:hypothetical protein
MPDDFSLFATLEPLCGAALTFSLAYLSLDRFRYRERIRTAAQLQLKLLPQRESPRIRTIAHLTQYQMLIRLAALPDNDPIGSQSDTSKAESTIRSRRGFHWDLEDEYQLLFGRHFDRKTTQYIAFATAAVLILGVVSRMFPTIEGSINWPPIIRGMSIAISSSALLFPAAMAWRGGEITRGLVEEAEYAKRQLAGTIKADIENLADEAAQTNGAALPADTSNTST